MLCLHQIPCPWICVLVACVREEGKAGAAPDHSSGGPAQGRGTQGRRTRPTTHTLSHLDRGAFSWGFLMGVYPVPEHYPPPSGVYARRRKMASSRTSLEGNSRMPKVPLSRNPAHWPMNVLLTHTHSCTELVVRTCSQETATRAKVQSAAPLPKRVESHRMHC